MVDVARAAVPVHDHSCWTAADTKLGGRPDLPDGLRWPETCDAWPHSLVAQIDLATVRSPLLPPDGLLSFFRDPDQQSMAGLPGRSATRRRARRWSAATGIPT